MLRRYAAAYLRHQTGKRMSDGTDPADVLDALEPLLEQLIAAGLRPPVVSEPLGYAVLFCPKGTTEWRFTAFAGRKTFGEQEVQRLNEVYPESDHAIAPIFPPLPQLEEAAHG